MAKIKANPCPTCGVVVDGATVIGQREDVRPNPGDFTLCVYCLSFLRYGEGLSLKLLSAEDYKELAGDQKALGILIKARMVLEQMPNRPTPGSALRKRTPAAGAKEGG